jgi:hypothetical protein
MEKIQISKIIVEKRDTTTNTNEILKIIKEYFRNLHSNKVKSKING